MPLFSIPNRARCVPESMAFLLLNPRMSRKASKLLGSCNSPSESSQSGCQVAIFQSKCRSFKQSAFDHAYGFICLTSDVGDIEPKSIAHSRK